MRNPPGAVPDTPTSSVVALRDSRVLVSMKIGGGFYESFGAEYIVLETFGHFAPIPLPGAARSAKLWNSLKFLLK